MINEQLFFNFELLPSYLKDDVVIANFNQNVAHILFNSPMWLVNTLIIIGNASVGKTFLSKVYLSLHKSLEIRIEDLFDYAKLEHLSATVEVLLIDNITLLSQKQAIGLMNLYNLTKQNNHKLIITSRQHPDFWGIKLLDLRSRINASLLLEITEPDDETLKIIAIKLLSDKQMLAEKEVISYILTRGKRNAQSILKIVEQIEQKILQTKKKLTIKLVKDIFEDDNKEGDHTW